MAQESQLANRVVTTTSIPYRSNISAIESDPCYVPGSENIMTSSTGFAERRPGFSSTVETTPTTFNDLQRLFTWERFDGTFIEIACDISSSNQSRVYTLIVGVDSSFSLLYTDTSSSSPFDFVVSNNTLYFSNGNVAKKYDPVNSITNWGIAIGSVNNASGPLPPGTAATFGDTGTTAWTNPNDIKVEDGNFATDISIGPSGPFADRISGTNFGFALATNTTILGILVEVKGFATFTGSQSGGLGVQLLKGGATAGAAQFNTWPASNAFVSFGGTSDLWGTTWTPNDINQATFGALISGTILNVAGNGNFNIDFVRITVYGIGGPSISVSGSAGTFTATIGYQYVFTYGNSNSGHVSSPSPASASTGPFANKLNVQVSLTASTDTQVNQIHVYRSTDSVTSGTMAGIYFEIPTSPYPNTTANITDNAPDTSLLISSIAPIPGANDPPTPGSDPVYFSGRIWLFKNNQVFFSGLEEIITGVPEESFPSGLAGNFWNFDQAVEALEVVGNGDNQQLMIFCAGRIYGIVGTSLDTFRRFLISNRRGARNIKSVSSIGGIVAWRDTSGQVWASDGSTLQEVGLDIRPDLTPYVPGNDSITFHSAGKFHWLVVSTGTELFVYDFDVGQWMPPWTFSCNCLFSGETSPGSYQLMAGTSSTALQMSSAGTAGTYNDNGTLYQMIARTQLFSLVPDYGKRFSYASMGVYNEPGRTGWLARVQIDTNNNVLGDVLVAVDDDPLDSTTTYTSIFNNLVTPQKAYNRGQGKNLLQKIYTLNSEGEGRWYSLEIKSAIADDTLKIYDFFGSYKPVGGR